MHILIVEDDERIVSFMKRGLEAESYEVTIASSKAQTLDLTEACTYDVIILDIFLGPDDGLDICRALRQRGVDSSILLMTAKGTAEIEKTSRHAGADAYLAKPFSFDDLIATITRLSMSANPTADPGSTMERCTNPLEKPSPEAFTKSAPHRPITMTRSDTNMSEYFSVDMNRLRGQL
ncbi:MAG TPA: response regulator [Nitrospira sp.]|nr:response regulator [Nitrospira sp.]